MDGEVDHVLRHGAEGEDDDEPDDAGKHAIVDRPVRDLVQELDRTPGDSNEDGVRTRASRGMTYSVDATDGRSRR